MASILQPVLCAVCQSCCKPLQRLPYIVASNFLCIHSHWFLCCSDFHKLHLCAQDLASGYMSGKLLHKLEAVHFMLQHHTSDHFGFLEDHTRYRTVFYHTLSRLLFMDDTPSNFKAFVGPLQQVRSVVLVLFTVCTATTHFTMQFL